MRHFRSLIKTIAVIAAVFVVTALHAQDGLRDALSHLDFSGDLSSGLLGPSIATADFNNDTHPDAAVLLRSNHSFRIEIHFRFQHVSRITFASNLPALSISTFDVNHDGSPDLVVEEPFSRQRLFIWLNDGYGSFRLAHVEDYPAERDDGYHRVASPSRNLESIALISPEKIRLRQTADHSYRLDLSTVAAPTKRGETLAFVGFDCAPNPLRGPPSRVLLRSRG